MEWAFELVNGYKSGDPRTRAFVRVHAHDRRSRSSTPTASTPRARPARPAERAAAAAAPDETPNLDHPVRVPAQELPGEQHERRRPGAGRLQPAARHRPVSSSASTPTATTAASGAAPAPAPDGGTPPGDYAQDYRGDGPFSEPETAEHPLARVSHRQVTTLITNHTFSNLVLRPPGIQAQGQPPDEGDLQGARRRDGRRERLHQPAAATSSTTPAAAPRTGPTTPPAGSASPSRSARATSTRRTPTRSPSTRAPPRPPTATAATATARPTSRRRSTRPTPPSTR